MNKVSRQTKYVPVTYKNKEFKVKVIPTSVLLLGLFILAAGCGKVLFSTHTTVKEAVPYKVVERDTVIKTVTKIKVVEKPDPLSRRIVRDFTKSYKPPIENKKITTFKYKGYTPYQIMMWHLKAHESFRPHQYPDGDYPSKGFGLNLSPEHIKWAKSQLGFHPKKRDWTFEEGQKLLVAYCQEHTLDPLKKQYPKLNPFQIVAYACHKYNTGNIRNFGYCCGSKSTKMRCGRKSKAHHTRRVFELQLFNGTLPASKIEADRAKAINLQQTYQ